MDSRIIITMNTSVWPHSIQRNGRTTLLGCLQLPTGHDRHAIFLVIDKTMQGSNKNAAYRAYRRTAPKSIEVILLPHFVARTFCGRLLEKHAQDTEYFDPGRDWPHPIEGHVNIPSATVFASPRAFSLCASQSVTTTYGNLTPCVSTLWVRVKRHAIHHWLYSLCTEDMWKVTARSHERGREHSTYYGRNLVCDHPVSQYSIGLRTYHF